jgi:metallo-beta-lactamase family protein
MSINVSQLLSKHNHEHRLSESECKAVCKTAKYVRTAEESKALNSLNVPAIIISASGMASGGRILHHLKNHISNHKDTILFVGYQDEDTRGRKILRGDKEVKIHGASYPVKAEIADLSSISAHADYEEILAWLGHFKKAPKITFITHGELEAAESLKEKITRQLGWKVVIPEYLEQENL